MDKTTMALSMCDRRTGVGADQLLLLVPSGKADFRMRIWNRDGSEVQMCGNGLRCVAGYIWSRGLRGAGALRIETAGGIVSPEEAGRLVRVDMGEAATDASRIPVKLQGKVMDYPLEVAGAIFPVTCVSMGNPHTVVFLDNVEGFPVAIYGPVIENHPLFPERTNVEFAQVSGPDEIRLRVWERGAGETPACGSGACASVVAAVMKKLTGRRVRVLLEGGELLIEYGEDGHVYMTGPAEEVFTGEITVKEGD